MPPMMAPPPAKPALPCWCGTKANRGTIGGGALEWQAIQTARNLLQSQANSLQRIPLGPRLGQCCGGAVTALLTEVYTSQTLPPKAEVIARSLDGTPMPLAVKRLLAAARNQGHPPQTRLLQGWMVEPLARPTRHLWVWGAGHVGRAVVGVLSALPDLQITWIDVAPDRFPEVAPDSVTILPAPDPVQASHLAPPNAEHLILTFSHSLDLELCHRLLTHGFQTCGLIGSATKWARFRSRLSALGHTQAEISTITCPIGDPSLGKHPQAIAVGVAMQFLKSAQIRSENLASQA